jgi:NTE family protein
MADTLIVGSGGTLAYGLLGALAHLVACDHLKKIDRFVGVSAGAILSVLLCAGVDIKTIVKTFFDSDFSSLQSLSPIMLLTSYGLDSGAKLMSKITSLIVKVGLNKHITFAQLKHTTKRELAVGVCDILEKRFILLSSENSPDVPVLDAVRASFAIPILYSPQTIGDRLCVDGAVMSSYPVGQCLLQWPQSNIIGVRVSQNTSSKRKINGILDFIQTLFSCVGTPSDWESAVHKSERFKDISIVIDATSMLASPSEAEKTRMFEAGYDASRLCFTEPEELD